MERSPTRDVDADRSDCWEVLLGSWAPVWAASWRINSVDGYDGDETDDNDERSSLMFDGTDPSWPVERPM
jgi:hypothetical protein